MNLKEATLEVLRNHGKRKEDVKYVCGEDFQISLEQFWELSDTEYDPYGAPEIATDLTLIGEDFWMERGEYDGAEWWDFRTMPDTTGLPIREITALSVRQYNAIWRPEYGKIGWETLSELNGEDTYHA